MPLSRFPVVRNGFVLLSRNGFLLAIGMLVLISLGVLAIQYQEIRSQVLQDASAQLKNNGQLRASIFQRQVEQKLEGLYFLQATPPIQGIVRAKQYDGLDPLENTPFELWVSRLQTIFSAYMTYSPGIRQLRYIGVADNGKELVRVDWKTVDEKNIDGESSAIAVPPEQLQAKGHRDYFAAIKQLQEHGQSAYLSDINLNREHKQIEQPAWPTMRLAKPVFDQGQFFGFVMMNIDSAFLLQLVDDDLPSNMQLFLLNAQGHYLFHPENGKAFAFEYDASPAWQDEHKVIAPPDPEQQNLKPLDSAWWVTNAEESKLLIYRTAIQFDADLNAPVFYLITAIDERELTAQIYRQLQTVALSDATLMLGLLLILVGVRLLSILSQRTRVARATMDSVFEGSRDAILRLDNSGIIREYNHAAALIFASSGQDLNNRSLASLFASEALQKRITTCIEQVEDGQVVPYQEITVEQGDAAPVITSLSLSPILDTHKRIIGVSAIFRDITLKANLRKALETTNKELEERNSEMESFVYTASHDLKSPLVTISGFSQLILAAEQDKLSEDSQHYLQRIINNANSMQNLLNELLHISRIIRQPLELNHCDIAQCVSKVCDALGVGIANQHASIHTQLNAPQVIANEYMLQQVLQNLISNALRYCDKTPEITVRSQSNAHGGIDISVQDNGIGISPKHQKQVFKLFERLNPSADAQSQKGGSGVGLAIVDSVMKKHKGSVILYSTEGEGSCFTLRFPKTETNAEASTEGRTNND